ncbi:Rad4 transglutaminase-like domain-containing protein [Phlyctema vagabunda]|uniref:Rad4 transglutaminase-like domain-containing protein n=1 Tax=Phlyctema vagabunda TaxID=108571 RepID=A0ABR4PVP2_9HELO
MPPFLPRKHLKSPSPEPESSKAGAKRGRPKGTGKAKASLHTPKKPTLFDDLDHGTKGTRRSAERNKAVLEQLAAVEDEESSLSSLSDAEFEDVPNAKRQRTSTSSDEDDEDIEFEDVPAPAAPGPSGPEPSGDLELTLTKETRISLTNPLGSKKGPSKIERQIRTSTHQVHVQMLLWHNAVRNSWLCDKELQGILLRHATSNTIVDKEITKWRQASGLVSKQEEVPPKGESNGRSKGSGKGKSKAPGQKTDVRASRDWGEPAEVLDPGKIDLRHGDPMFKLLQNISKYWRKRFRIIAPGLRKKGYMSLERLDEETKGFVTDKHDAERHGERIKNMREFRQCAQAMEGSRDVGAQLFTALLRAIGLETRMVANLQPVGFGWNKNEDAAPRKEKKLKDPAKQIDDSSEEDEADINTDSEDPKPAVISQKARRGKPSENSTVPKQHKSSGPSSRASTTIDISASEVAEGEDDDDSVVDITPGRPRILPSKPYDKDLLYPYYWSEALSPVTNTFTAVDPLVLNIVATNAELLERFEPRGAKAEKAKQVTSYIVGHSADGTAKDVTTRYLKRHMWPGRTKGNRLPPEKVPVYNQKGKIKRYEEYDWFKTVMSGYVRGTRKCPRTEVDDHEEATDLKPVKPEKKEVKEGEETLQSYKSSAEFVLERHLRREEAILPTAKHVKMFTVKGKGDTSTEEKVYLRRDVVSCKSTETWHKEGRAPVPGEEPLKRVPYRAATTNRKRELAEAEHATGEKMLQGLYSRAQTDWIIPPPIENGIIPKNSFGNMDVYVPSMVPEGAVHIPRRSTMKICKRLGIDYAEAVTGFEFGARMAIPIITGVVVAEENLDLVMEEWEKDERERARKEDEKRTKAAIGMWRKMLMGLRIVERVREEYGDEVGDEVDVLNPWTNKNKGKEKDRTEEEEAQRRIMQARDEELAGGFLPEGHDEDELQNGQPTSFFPVVHEDDDDQGGGFVVEGHDEVLPSAVPAESSPQSFEYDRRSAPDHDMDQPDDLLDDEDPEPDLPVPAPKKRGRPAGSTKIKTPARNQAKTPASSVKKASAPRSAGRRKRTIPDSEDEEEASVDTAESEEEDDVPKKAVGSRERKASSPIRPPESTRKTPRRNAARKSETALKSHYFENSEEDDDE